MEVMGLASRIHVNKFELSADSSGQEAGPSAPVAVVDGYIVPCPSCQKSHSIDKHQLGTTFECSACLKPVHIDISLVEAASHVYCDCPRCDQQLKLTPEWLDSTVTCEFCGSTMTVRKIR